MRKSKKQRELEATLSAVQEIVVEAGVVGTGKDVAVTSPLTNTQRQIFKVYTTLSPKDRRNVQRVAEAAGCQWITAKRAMTNPEWDRLEQEWLESQRHIGEQTIDNLKKSMGFISKLMKQLESSNEVELDSEKARGYLVIHKLLLETAKTIADAGLIEKDKQAGDTTEGSEALLDDLRNAYLLGAAYRGDASKLSEMLIFFKENFYVKSIDVKEIGGPESPPLIECLDKVDD